MIDLSLPMQELLQEKIKYLKETIAKAQEELRTANNMLSFLNGEKQGVLSHTSQIEQVRNTVTKQTDVALTQTGIPSQSIIRPLVISFFKSHEGRYKTSDIFEAIKDGETIPKNIDRRKLITGISLCLNTLTKSGNPKIKKYDTDNNNVKEYEWIAD